MIGAEKITGHLLSTYWVPDIVMGWLMLTLSLSFCSCSFLQYPDKSNLMEKGLILLTVQGTIHQCGKSQGSRSLRHLLTSHSLSRNNTECFLVLSLLSPFCAFWNALPLEWS